MLGSEIRLSAADCLISVLDAFFQLTLVVGSGRCLLGHLLMILFVFASWGAYLSIQDFATSEYM